MFLQASVCLHPIWICLNGRPSRLSRISKKQLSAWPLIYYFDTWNLPPSNTVVKLMLVISKLSPTSFLRTYQASLFLSFACTFFERDCFTVPALSLQETTLSKERTNCKGDFMSILTLLRLSQKWPTMTFKIFFKLQIQKFHRVRENLKK